MNVNNQYKVAAVQASPVFLDANATIDKTIALMEEAAKNGAKVIAFLKHGFRAIPGLSGSMHRLGDYNLFRNILKIPSARWP